MNSIALLLISTTTKKQIYLVLAILVIILSLPIMAVFALGSSTLSILSLGIGSSESDGLYQGPLSTTDTYAWGNCTYWAALLRQQAKDPIPNSWGNAATWAFYAGLDGYLVDHTPAVGSIMQISDVDHGLGHVAYVESVDSSTGAWTISEMNVKGLDIVDSKSLPASSAVKYNFIHDKLDP
jgi:surface antigen